jgi:UDP-2-acetamido-3-amino-2,3-dideoxy-glucuronate N-acetyltransferase
MRAAFVHPTAVIDPSANIGDDARIWHFVHVSANARIGAGTSIGQGCYVGNVQIGARCKIQNNVSIYDGVSVADDVFLGPSCVFTNVQHPRAHVSRKDSYAKTSIARGASIGANATIVCGDRGITVGEYAFVGAGAVVTHDVAPHALVVGVPARQVGWVCSCGETLAVRAGGQSCHRCAASYEIVDDNLRVL